MKQLITASSLAKFQSCPRAYFYRYVRNLVKLETSDALRFGTAWHTAMEARWNGATFDDALLSAQKDKLVGQWEFTMLAAMLYCYYQIYGSATQDASFITMEPEIEFRLPIKSVRMFDAGGKIDGIGADRNTGFTKLVEHKTTSDSLDIDSDYWVRLKFNTQILQYIWATMNLKGLKQVDCVVYDVAKKPALRPKEIPTLDSDGLKQVVDAFGQRIYNKDGKTPRQSIGEGYSFVSQMETPEQYFERLVDDITSRKEFYFCRKEVTILSSDIEMFELQRMMIIKNIQNCMKLFKKYGASAYVRNCTSSNCRMCEYQGFCLTTLTDIGDTIPDGFTVSEKSHSELEMKQ